ncbi:response regulator [Levilinea saccharolytica]|uniref:response regulator n=1 Tax=Levilinea saccharolytica TaxID=229921 RepID=UPI001364DE2A|nr:response regulator [Levilinea saccharolytica]
MDPNLPSVSSNPIEHAAGVPQPRVRILVVDDNLLDVRLCQHILQRAGFEVHSVTDPRIALELMTQMPFDLLLADIYMPEMDGFELILEAKKRQSELAVLVMTGSSMVEDAIRALERGVDGLILKPFEEGHQLVSAVQHAIVESRQRKDAARLQVLRPLFSATEALNSESHLETLSRLTSHLTV